MVWKNGECVDRLTTSLRDLCIRRYTREGLACVISNARLPTLDPQGREGTDADPRRKSVAVTAKELEEVSRCAEISLRRSEERGSGRRCYRLGLDRCRRRAADHRRRDDARQGQDDRGHRQLARCDEGIDLGRCILCALAVHPAFGIEPPLFDKRDIHVHVPEGATPKDGPSAGVAMVTAIVSVMTGIPVRRDVAMTGEISAARPRAADRRSEGESCWPRPCAAGIKTVLIPEENAKDLADISQTVKNGLEIIPVSAWTRFWRARWCASPSRSSSRSSRWPKPGA